MDYKYILRIVIRCRDALQRFYIILYIVSLWSRWQRNAALFMLKIYGPVNIAMKIIFAFIIDNTLVVDRVGN